MALAPLGFTVDTSPVAKAVADLGKLTDATQKAQQETAKVFRVDNAASQYAQRIDNSARALRGFEAIAAKTAATAKHVTDQMMRMTAHELRDNDIQAYGRELDALRAKFNPVFAASKRYEAELNELNRAHKVGAISASEHGMALTELNARYQQAGAGAKAYGTSAGMARMQTQNLMYQFQDISMMMALGQNPFVLLAQQLPQVVQHGGRLNGVMGALKQTIGGLFSPLGLLTTGFVLAGSAAVAYFSSGEKAKTLSDALDSHTSALDKVREMYGRAGSAADKFGRESTTQLAAMERRARAAAEEMARLANIDLSKALSDSGGFSGFGLLHRLMTPAEFRAVRLEFAAFAEPIARIRQEIAAGTPDFETFQRAIEGVVATRSDLRSTADEILHLASESINAARWLGDTADEMRNASPAAIAYATSVRDLSDLIENIHSEKAQQELADLAEEAINGSKKTDELKKALAAISGYAPDLSTAISRFLELAGAAKQAKDEIVGFTGKESQGGRTRYGTTGFMQLPENVGVTPTARVDPYFEDWRKKTPKSQAERDAERAKKAYDDMIRQSQQFIAAQRLEQEALFMTEEAANALRYEQELLNQAANDNIKLTPEMKRELEGLAQQMASTEAETNRLHDALKFGKDLVRGFVSDLRSGLEQGKGFWKSFGDAAMNVLDKIVDKLLNDVIDALFQVNSAAGGMGGGSFLGGLFGGIGKLFGFASGGYTGPGAASQPAGIVHAGEYVFSKSAVDRIGLGYLDSLHSAAKGYMNGGYVRSHAPANVNMRGYQSGGYVRPHSGGQEVLKIELVSRFDADGGFESAVERSSRPVAMQESAKAAGQVARAVPSMAIGAMDDSRTRRRRTISPGGVI